MHHKDDAGFYKLKSTTMQMPQQMYNDMLRLRDANRYRWDYAPSHLTIADLDERRIRNAVSMGVLNGRQNVRQNVRQNDRLNDRQKKVKIMIRDNDRISVALISNALEVTTKTIYRDLKIIGIHWEGSPKTGHWVFD